MCAQRLTPPFFRVSSSRSQSESSGFEYFPRAALEDHPDEEIDLPPVEIHNLRQSKSLETGFQRPDETMSLEGRRIIPKVPAASAVYAEEMIESHGIVEELIASDKNQIAIKVKKRPKRKGLSNFCPNISPNIP